MRRIPGLVSMLAVCMLGIMALAGCTPVAAPEAPAQWPQPKPTSGLPPLPWSGVKPRLPEFTVWEYAAQPTPPIDVEQLLARIWKGQKYEAFDHAESGRLYRLPLYQSRYGRFREELDTFGKGFIFRWEINENYPKAKPMDKSPDQAYEHALKYARDFLGDSRYTEYPVPFVFAVDEDGAEVNHFYEFNWEHRIGSIPVYSEGVSLRMIPEGVPRLSLSWSTFAPMQTKPDRKPLSFDDALLSLNHVRSLVDPKRCSEYGKDDCLVAARVVYSNMFSDNPAVYRPVWEFTLSRASKKSYRLPVLVDSMTGSVWSNHDGIVESYLGGGGR